MKKIRLNLLTLGLAVFAVPASAADVMVAAAMQRCTANEDCQLVTNICADNCGFVPVNKSNMATLQQLYQTRCGKPMDANPACTMNPPINAACINSRCTIDYAYANNAGAKDYQSGAYGVPEAPAPDKVKGDYSHVNDRKGFTAYDLPQDEVRKGDVGTLTEKVYVPPSAPVSGGSYVPVGAAPAAAATPPAPMPSASPAPMPPSVPPAAMPTGSSYATPPVMTPSMPNQMPPMPTPQPIPDTTYMPPQAPPVPMATGKPVAGEAYVPAPTVPTMSAPGLPVPRTPNGSGVPAVGATGVPQAPPGAVPIPPSDLKPAPTYVPPPGAAIPVAPGDPGAPPPEGTTLMPPVDGKLTTTIPPPADMTPPPTGVKDPEMAKPKSYEGTATVNKKSFSTVTKTKKVYDTNQ